MKKVFTILFVLVSAILANRLQAQGLRSIDSTSFGDIIYGPKWFHDSLGLYALRGGLGASQLLSTDSIGRVVLVTTTGGCPYACDTNNTMATIFYTDSLVSATIGGGSAWQLTGNTGTSPTFNFIGTVDNENLVFKVNNQLSGLLDNSNGNTAFGVNTFVGNSTGGNNLATGTYALYSNTIGSGNTALGEAALDENTSGNNNTVVGNNSFSGNITGTGLTGLGAGCNATGSGISNATAIGYNALVGQSNSTSIGDTTQPLLVGVGTAYPLAAIDVRVTAATGPVPAGLFTGGRVGIGTYSPAATLQIGDTVIGIATFEYIDGNQGAGKVLTSDANGNATWQTAPRLPPVLDSVTTLSGGTITLTNNSYNIITASTTITSQTINFPSGQTGDQIEIKFAKAIMSITTGGTGYGTVTINGSGSNFVAFTNYGGNWY